MYLILTFPARPITCLAMSFNDNSIVRCDKTEGTVIRVRGSTRNQYDRKIEYLSLSRVRVPVRVLTITHSFPVV